MSFNFILKHKVAGDGPTPGGTVTTINLIGGTVNWGETHPKISK